MPRIAFDDQVFSLQTHGGISRYFVELHRRLRAGSDFEAELLAGFHRNAHVRDLESAGVMGIFTPRFPGGERVRRRVNRELASGWLRARRPDIVHETYYTRSPRGSRRTCRVVTVYDMIHERLPRHFPRHDRTAAAKAAAVRRADHVVCISQRTRDDLIEILEVPAERTSVVYLGCSVTAAPQPPPPVAGPYVLFVGPRGGYKNFPHLLEAYAASGLAAGGVALVCAGGDRLSAEERRRVMELQIDPRLVSQSPVDDAALASLYAHASLLAYPSLYEGFGIPPLEAMAHGCPVVCSRAGSLPEVVGDAAELVDPLDVAELARALERVCEDAERAAELRRCGLLRAARFSWDRSAAASLGVYRALA